MNLRTVRNSVNKITYSCPYPPFPLKPNGSYPRFSYDGLDIATDYFVVWNKNDMENNS